jgi:hypothetical protein
MLALVCGCASPSAPVNAPTQSGGARAPSRPPCRGDQGHVPDCGTTVDVQRPRSLEAEVERCILSALERWRFPLAGAASKFAVPLDVPVSRARR